MHILKIILRGVSSSMFKLSLFLLAITAALATAFGSPDVLKQSLSDSGVYDSFVKSSLETAQKEQDKAANEVPLDRPEVIAAAQAAFTPGFLKSTTEQFIGSIYDWLQERTPQPSFTIDLTEAKRNFIQSLASYAEHRAGSLPSCTLQQVRELQGSDIDPFNVSCLPPGLPPILIRQKVVSDLENSKDFLQDPVFTEEDLPKNEEGKTIFQRADQAPELYKRANSAPYLFATLACITAAGIIFLNEERRRGIRSVGFSFLSVGVIVLASTWFVSYMMSYARRPGSALDKMSTDNFQRALFELVSNVTAVLNNKLYIFCFVYILIGIGILVTLRLTGQRQPSLTPSDGITTTPPHDQVANRRQETTSTIARRP